MGATLMKNYKMFRPFKFNVKLNQAIKLFSLNKILLKDSRNLLIKSRHNTVKRKKLAAKQGKVITILIQRLAVKMSLIVEICQREA